MSAKCPSCNYTNIPGADRCEQCMHSLMQTDIPRPKRNDKLQQVMMTTPVADLLTGKDLLVANERDSIAKIIKIFQENNKRVILVYRKKKLVGILGNRTIVRSVAKKGLDLSKITVGEVMKLNPEYVRAEDPIAYALNKMAMGSVRTLPVLREDGTPISVITIKDILVYLSKRNKSTV